MITKKELAIFLSIFISFSIFLGFAGYKNWEAEKQREIDKLIAKGAVINPEPFEVRHAKLVERNEKEYQRRLVEECTSFYKNSPTKIITSKENLGNIGDYIVIKQKNPYSHKIEDIAVCVKNVYTGKNTEKYIPLLNNCADLKENEAWIVLDVEVDLQDYSKYETGFDFRFSNFYVEYEDEDFVYSTIVHQIDEKKDIVMPNEDFGTCTVAFKYRTDKDIQYLKIGSIHEYTGYMKFI